MTYFCSFLLAWTVMKEKEQEDGFYPKLYHLQSLGKTASRVQSVPNVMLYNTSLSAAWAMESERSFYIHKTHFVCMIPELALFFKTSFGPPPTLCSSCFSFVIQYVWDCVCHEQSGIGCVDVSCKRRWWGGWKSRGGMRVRANETARMDAEASAPALMWMNACGTLQSLLA